MNYVIKMSSGELYHHGVKGQKWGERNYQNEDGSYKSGAEGRYDPEPSGKSGSGKTKNAVSIKAAGHKVMAKVYALNEKTYAGSKKSEKLSSDNAKNAAIRKYKKQHPETTLSKREILKTVYGV